MRKLEWQTQTGGADESEAGFFQKFKSTVVGGIKGIVTGGLSTLFGLIIIILEVILRVLWFLFTVVIPYMVAYVGVPLFILGAILGLVFTVGHVFFLVAFFVGVYLYMRGIIRVAFPKKMFNLNVSSNSTPPVSG